MLRLCQTEDGEIPKSRANFLKGMRTDLFDYQVTGLAHFLGNVFGEIPVENIDKDLLDLETLKHIQRFALQASWVCDLPDIGRTLVYLAFLLWVAKHAKPGTNKEGKSFYRSGLLVVPRSVIPQIFGIIYNKVSGTHAYLVLYGRRALYSV